jgi:outer membrane murein-binding lipoprotein Lpp
MGSLWFIERYIVGSILKYDSAILKNRDVCTGSTAIAVLISLVLSACGKSEVELQREQIEEPESKISDIKSEVDNLENAQAQLATAVSSFDDENWRDVVPEVQSAPSEIEQVTAEPKDAAE